MLKIFKRKLPVPKVVLTEQIFMCNFCGKSNHYTEKMITSDKHAPNNVNICKECVQFCVEIIEGKVKTNEDKNGSH